jgi:hypothetical protein
VPTIPGIALDAFAADPADRLQAGRALRGRARKALDRTLTGWPPDSPGAANAWLLLVTGKAPTWRDPLMVWPDDAPTLGEPHPGFFYPDPLGFWAEVRRWVAILVRNVAPGLSPTEALAVAAVVHTGEDPEAVAWVSERVKPVITLFLDEASRASSRVIPGGTPYSIPDPHRPGTVYEGWWVRSAHGSVVGKAPQHPASHNFYRSADMEVFLRASPTPLRLTSPIG